MPKTKMSKVEKLIEEYRDVEFVSSSGKTEQFKGFARKFKNALKEQMEPEFEIVEYSIGHFYISGFVRNRENGEYLYFKTPDVRAFRNAWFESVLCRIAYDVRDFRGGLNNFTRLTNLKELALKLT